MDVTRRHAPFLGDGFAYRNDPTIAITPPATARTGPRDVIARRRRFKDGAWQWDLVRRGDRFPHREDLTMAIHRHNALRVNMAACFEPPRPIPPPHPITVNQLPAGGGHQSWNRQDRRRSRSSHVLCSSTVPGLFQARYATLSYVPGPFHAR
jgi:predicted acylesterase/phospholipase RssA